MSPEHNVVVEIFGEGKTDVGHDPRPQPPVRGVVPILVHTLCGRPDRMLVKRYGVPFLQQKGTGKGLWQKVRFARRQASYNGSDAAVFVEDSDGDLKKKHGELTKGRDHGPSKLPMAIGVAHRCIEAWLLSDATAIRRGLDLPETPAVPDTPEDLAAPCQDRKRNLKTELARIAGSRKKELSTKEKDSIAGKMNDMALPRARCPLGFAPFADEVEDRILPLF